MTIPSAKYLSGKQGKKAYVQLAAQDWEQVVEEFERMKNLLNFKQELKEAFREVRQIQRGEKKGTTLKEFLGYSQPIQPMTWKELQTRIDQSEQDYANGNSYTVEQLDEEMKSW